MTKVCKFYVKGNCKEKACKFNHIDNICRNYFFGECSNNLCKFDHTYKLSNYNTNITNKDTNFKDTNFKDTNFKDTNFKDTNNNSKYSNNNSKKNKVKKFVNTENYNPSFRPHDMIVKLILNKDDTNNISERDVFLCPNIFTNNNYYNTLLDEIKQIGKDDIFKLWHGDTHYIVDDHINWKKLCPKFMEIINIIKEYFDIDVKATRFNWYENSNNFKPYHFDAAAFDEEKAKFQNITIGISFGAKRDIEFEHAVSKNTVSFPLANGMVYGFSKQVNIDWRHGIPQIHPDNFIEQGRISIIIWGYRELKN